MITNQRQYLYTLAQAQRFRAMLASDVAAHTDERADRAMRSGWRRQLQALEAEVAAYEALRDGGEATWEADSIADIGNALVRARIARQLTHRQLAGRLGLAEQQIQRYEATRYRGVAAERLQQVADALGLRVHGQFTMEPG